MSQDVMITVQLVSILVGAVGAPGLTFWVLKRMSRETIAHIQDNCHACRARLDEKIGKLEQEMEVVADRQLRLRENLPIEYVRREEFNRHLNDVKK